MTPAPGPSNGSLRAGRSSRSPNWLARLDFTVLVAPETTGILARLTRTIQSVGARVLGSLDYAIDLTANKEGLCRWFEARGIATPPSRAINPREGLPADLEYPAVLKPIDGAGAVNTFYLSDSRSLPAAACEMPRALVQPFVSGVPMSASFLVNVHAMAWLIGVGTQQVTVHDGRFKYRGGRLPTPCPSAVPRLRAIVESIPGLQGFVGVDFLWDEARRHATILEINPRPTTSCVGLTRLLPPGQLASAWLGAFDCQWGDAELLHRLADQAHGSRSLSFDASGVVSFDGGDFE